MRSARSRGVSRRDQLNERKILAAADVGQRAGLFHGQVGHDRPGNARRLGLGHVPLQSMPKDDRIAQHRHDRRQVNFAAVTSADHRQRVGQFDLVIERPGERGLNHRTVGHRVAVRNAEFEQAAPPRGQPADDFGSEVQVGIARGHKRHERLTSGGTKLCKNSVDGGHGDRD